MSDAIYRVQGYDKDSDIYETIVKVPDIQQAKTAAKAVLYNQTHGLIYRCTETGEPFDWFVIANSEEDTILVFTEEFPDGVSPEELEEKPPKKKEPDMKWIVYVSIDKPERWTQWHTGSTDSVYQSGPYDTDEQVETFRKAVAKDYPDSNLKDGKGGHEYRIRFAVVSVDMNDEENLESISGMMRAYQSYDKR